MDDYKNYRQDSFSLFDSAEAGAILGAIVAGCFLYDCYQRIAAWFS